MAAPGLYQPGEYFQGNAGSHYGGTRRRLQYEVFFPFEFTTRYPQDHSELPNLDLVDLPIPIEKLSHVTHNREARAIYEEPLQNYNFIATSKVGKAYEWDGSPRGESFKYDIVRDQGGAASRLYKYIRRDEQNPLLPGKYSWWGISTGDWLKRDDSEVFQGACENIPNKAGYLMEPPESRYGNNEFKVDLAHLLQSYQRARGDPELPDDQGPPIYLKKAGTLRYKKEICFVIVVCSSGDLDLLGQHYAAPDQVPVAVQGPGDNADLGQDPGAAPAEIPVQFLGPDPDRSVVVNFNGLINNEGLVDPALDDTVNNHIPEFFPRHICIDSYSSWVTLAFGCYFPGDHDGRITVARDKMERVDIKHDGLCVKKQPNPANRYDWNCPNQY